MLNYHTKFSPCCLKVTDLWNKELASAYMTALSTHSKFTAGDNTFKSYHNNNKYLSRFFFFVLKHIFSLRQLLFVSLLLAFDYQASFI